MTIPPQSRPLLGAHISLIYLPLEEAQKMAVLRYGIHKRAPASAAKIPKLRQVP
jgi:hypothetical protein